MCFAIFELIKFTCFSSTLSYPHKEFLNPHPQQVQPAPHAKQCEFPTSRTRPANAGTCNPRRTLALSLQKSQLPWVPATRAGL